MLRQDCGEKIVLSTVGLPASGKTYLCQKINRYINWLGYEADVFSIQNYRRKNVKVDPTADFFNPYNKHSCEIR
jgi:hypothetical protein